MLSGRGILIGKSIPEKKENGVLRSAAVRMRPAVSAESPLVIIVQNRSTPTGLPLCSGDTSSRSQAAVIAAPRRESPCRTPAATRSRVGGASGLPCPLFHPSRPGAQAPLSAAGARQRVGNVVQWIPEGACVSSGM